jgi:hypothetical protein
MAFSLAVARAGNNIAAKIAMMAMTTRSSINVKALRIGRIRGDAFISKLIYGISLVLKRLPQLPKLRQPHSPTLFQG